MAVGGAKRGIVASASYEARKQGVYTPMPTAQARRVCPKLIVIPGDFSKYEHFSRMMFSYAYDFTPEVEVGSIDEGYVDLRSQRKKPAREIADTIRMAVAQSLKLSASFGIGSNKLVSQVASKLQKPGCFIEVPSGTERGFLAPLPNRWMPSIGPKVGTTLDAAGLKRVEQIAQTSPELLAYFVGGYAPQLWKFAHGIDDRPVIAEHADAKSYGEQETFGEDVTDKVFVLATLRGMADRLMAKVRADGKTARTATVKLRYNDFSESTRCRSLDEPTDIETDFYAAIAGLVEAAWERRVSLRLVSLKLSNIYGGVFRQELALTTATNTYQQKKGLVEAIDSLRSRYGKTAVMRGHDLWLKRQDGKPRNDLHRATGRHAKSVVIHKSAPDFYPLNCKSYYSFCDSLLSPEAIVDIAVRAGAKVVALTDPNLHGAVPFYQAAVAAGIKPIIGAELNVRWNRRLAYVENATGYRNLCFLLSQPTLSTELVVEHGAGLRLIPDTAFPAIRYRLPEEKLGYQIIQSIRTLTLLPDPHREKRVGSFHVPAKEEWPTDTRTMEELVDACDFRFEFGKLHFPAYLPKDGSSPREMLRRLAMEGLRRRYGDRQGDHASQLQEELTIIGEVGYEEYFLTVWDMLQECQREGIEWITRGSAADSLVCYCLGISGVCPIRFDLYFRRFLNRDRMALNKLPDIDLDFPHDRKDDVVDLVFRRFGKRYHPAEFLSAVLTNEKGFYSPLAYTLEARRLGIGFLSPDVNASRKGFYPEYRDGKAFVRVPLWKVKELSDETIDRIEKEVRQNPFASLADFYQRVEPTKPEAQNLIRAGAFDGFGLPRTTQFWHLQQLADWPHDGGQGMLFASTDRPLQVPAAALTEPTLMDRLKDELELLGFTVSGHPLDLFPLIVWEKYFPIAELGKHFGERVKVCGLSFADRIAHQIDGQPMKFVSLCDYTGFVETEMFAAVYRAFGMETIKSPVIEVEGFVEPFENRNGCTLRVLKVSTL